jgi:hypothetical protein
MKKYYVAANILGAVEVRAESAEEAHAKASHFLSKRFQLQAKPTGLWVFEKNDTNMTATPAPDAGSGTGA